jgi:hypothetical protein
MQAWGSGPAMPPQNYVVPNVTFAEPYAQYPQPQQSMAIIGGYAVRKSSGMKQDLKEGCEEAITTSDERRRGSLQPRRWLDACCPCWP